MFSIAIVANLDAGDAPFLTRKNNSPSTFLSETWTKRFWTKISLHKNSFPTLRRFFFTTLFAKILEIFPHL